MTRNNPPYKPCPFCGGTNIKYHRPDYIGGGWNECDDCGAQGPNTEYSDLGWNDRAGNKVDDKATQTEETTLS